jgi:hypothetical protein
LKTVNWNILLRAGEAEGGLVSARESKSSYLRIGTPIASDAYVGPRKLVKAPEVIWRNASDLVT